MTYSTQTNVGTSSRPQAMPQIKSRFSAVHDIGERDIVRPRERRRKAGCQIQLSTQCYALASRIGSAFKAFGPDRDGVKPGIQTAYVHFETN